MTLRMTLLLVAGFLMVDGLILYWLWRRNRKRVEDSQNWPSVEGVISHASSSEDEGVHTLKVKYTYTVDSQERTGDTVRIGGVRIPAKPELDQWLTRYAPGQRVTVFYDRENVKRSVLERQPAGGQWVLALAAAVSVLFGLVALGFAAAMEGPF